MQLGNVDVEDASDVLDWCFQCEFVIKTQIRGPSAPTTPSGDVDDFGFAPRRREFAFEQSGKADLARGFPHFVQTHRPHAKASDSSGAAMVDPLDVTLFRH